MADENRRAGNPMDQPPDVDAQDVSQQDENRTGRRSRKKPELSIAGVKLTVGHLIAMRRRELGWTQEELSWRCGVSRTQIGRIERDECEPMVSSIENLEEALGIELYDLFMEQHRERSKARRKKKRELFAGAAIGQFERKLAKTGISKDDLKDVLDEALKSADSLSKSKK